jgi:5-methyltetrahydrofolate--homocysteine methyltransferase
LISGGAPGPVVTDGAWGTELQRLGLEFSECADAWNLSRPHLVESVARSYVEAGSQVILTNTFRANAVALAPYGLADRVQHINAAGVAISKRAADGKARVFASIGPIGEALVSAFHEQAQALAGAGADALVIETMSDIGEARVAAAAAKSTGLPVIVSFTFGAGDLTSTNATPEQIARAMVEAGIAAIGANCGVGIERFSSICRRFRSVCNLPLWIKPSAGLPPYRITPDEFASAMQPVLAAGADFVGGCCGTTPGFIRELGNQVRACRRSK